MDRNNHSFLGPEVTAKKLISGIVQNGMEMLIFVPQIVVIFVLIFVLIFVVIFVALSRVEHSW